MGSGRRMTGPPMAPDRPSPPSPRAPPPRPRARRPSCVALPIGRRRLRRSAATSRSRKMIVWPVVSSSPMTANSRIALTASGQCQATLSGVRTTKNTRTATWNRKQPRPGPRSGSRSAPLYWTGPRRRVADGAASGRRRGSVWVTSANDTGGAVRPQAAPWQGRRRPRRRAAPAGSRVGRAPSTTATRRRGRSAPAA